MMTRPRCRELNLSPSGTEKPRRRVHPRQRVSFDELFQSMIRKSGYRFSLATNAERVCAEIMLKQEARAR